MARPIWTGSVGFGLVSLPVALYAATEDRTVHFNQFQAGTSDRIRYKRVNERTGREVDLADIVRGHEVSKGDYVLVTDEELIERKQREEEIVTEAAPPEDSSVVDLADALRRSMEAQRRRSSAGRSTGHRTGKRGNDGATPARKGAAGSGTSRARSSGKTAPKAKSRPKRKAS